MTYPLLAEEHIDLSNDRISSEDAHRQTQAAGEILRRFDRQPGVILADEVGMGKTFVALAVAVSVILARRDGDPVVVMCPPALREKWPKDWSVFKELCLPKSLGTDLRAGRADSGLKFLQLLDDPPHRRAHIIFLTHGALDRSLTDGLVKLAVIKRALKGRSSLAAQRRSFGGFAGTLLRLEWLDRRAPGLLAKLLDQPYDTWLKTIHRADSALKEQFADDPIPAHLSRVLETMEGSALNDVIEGLRQIPLRNSLKVTERLKTARHGLAMAMEGVWRAALRDAGFRSPLLILDEAHHVKNPGTRLASLFASEEAALESKKYFSSAGPLGGKFERMLFLTATPFQLGHGELIRILERFEGISWKGPHAPLLSRDDIKLELRALGSVLDDAQSAALRLDRAWGRLRPDDLPDPASTADESGSWWQRAVLEQGDGVIAGLKLQVDTARLAIEGSERALSPWVLRYLRAEPFA